MMQQRETKLDTAEAVADLMYERHSRGNHKIERYAEAYVSEMAESDRRWEENNTEGAHPWADTASYTIPLDRAQDALRDLRIEMRVNGTWNAGTWGEGAEKFLERLKQERTQGDLGWGI